MNELIENPLSRSLVYVGRCIPTACSFSFTYSVVTGKLRLTPERVMGPNVGHLVKPGTG